MQMSRTRASVSVALSALAMLLSSTALTWAQDKPAEDAMSAAGRGAARVRAAIEAELGARADLGPSSPFIAESNRTLSDDDVCSNDPRCPAGLREGPSGGQAELSIAVTPNGQHIVVGFNDTRGFSRNPVSVSGYMYSHDYGKTFTDGGQLPVSGHPGTIPASSIGTTNLPQIFGDPEVKYLGGCTFVYSSIVVRRLPLGGTAQTMGVHRSLDCGATWQGPYEVQAATNPNGLLSTTGSALDAADKEFMDVDPDTGRLMMTWSNFGVVAVAGTLRRIIEIRSAISDDEGRTWPAANGRVIAATVADGQSSIPRFARGSNNVYAAWRRFPFPSALLGYGNVTAFARSTDNGLTWEAPIELSAEFLTQDQILGNDRSNTSPSLAVDVSFGPHAGNVYVVYPNNNSNDGSDIVFQRSTDGGRTFSTPMLINASPGRDRAQWFSWVTVDGKTGRIAVFYYDQGIATSGDLTEVSYLYSNDGGRTWSHPRPLTDRPFHAGHGNDTSQPNLGDYNQAVAWDGNTYFAYSLADSPPLGFVDGQPALSLTVPDAKVVIHTSETDAVPHAPVSLRDVRVMAPGGYADPDEEIVLHLPLFNYATNPLYGRTIAAVTGRLSTDNGLAWIVEGAASYGSIAPGETKASAAPYRIRLDRKFVPGTPIEFTLHVMSSVGVATLRYTLLTGTPVMTTLLSEDFETAGVGMLPTGWVASHAGGVNTVPWITSNTFCGTSNGAFHANANDGPAFGQATRWERLFSPTFSVPADSESVIVEFDICYNTEDDVVLPTTAYDGVFLRVTDVTPGRTLRSILVEAFASEFTTGDGHHYPKHLPRSSNPAYFEDMSAWAGDSGGVKRVRLRLPGMAGSAAQLRFEYTQDFAFTCQDLRPGTACGVFVDNVVIMSAVTKKPEPVMKRTR